ncbi:ATP-binding cassette domain-containing protein [Proteocatella sphenisci]|uniref:ATP-binding cassette domain-containing protein n=1 Tax=Proteocatella sphenisci TaxID=181070 RepID=UPI0004B44DF3|nr:ABC transporter ATP-binding protein [Proteocatella sphenisci]
MKNILSIKDITVSFNNEEGEVRALNKVNLELQKGQILALVGESGCGKTVLCKTILQILCKKGIVKSGEIILDGVNLLGLGEKEMRSVRGRDISMVFQNPLTSLNPSISVGKQISEVMRIHFKMTKSQAIEKTYRLMEEVGLSDVELRYKQMPHQFSGGMRQRIAIAIALAANPKLLLADEPTTFLDIEVQEQILELIKTYSQKHGIAVIFITHDLSIVEDIADRVIIMKDGNILESGKTEKVFANPEHDYTKELIKYANYGKRSGHSHGLLNQELRKYSEKLVEVKKLSKSFNLSQKKVNAVLKDLDMHIYKGEILGVVGPSGCGKSTLARCIMGIYNPDQGNITFNTTKNKDNTNWKQMIFQDSFSSLNPGMTLEKIIGEPIRIKDGKFPKRETVLKLMDEVELERNLIDRYPYEISGGQRQRAAIARAISTNPDFIIADEPISSLDVSIQAQIIHLFKKLNSERGITLMIIAHDLPMLKHISDRIIYF